MSHNAIFKSRMVNTTSLAKALQRLDFEVESCTEDSLASRHKDVSYMYLYADREGDELKLSYDEDIQKSWRGVDSDLRSNPIQRLEHWYNVYDQARAYEEEGYSVDIEESVVDGKSRVILSATMEDQELETAAAI